MLHRYGQNTAKYSLAFGYILFPFDQVFFFPRRAWLSPPVAHDRWEAKILDTIKTLLTVTLDLEIIVDPFLHLFLLKAVFTYIGFHFSF